MTFTFVYDVLEKLSFEIFSKLAFYGPKIGAAILILFVGAVISYGIYRATLYIFWKFRIIDFINRLWDGFEENTTKMVDKNCEDKEEEKNKKSDTPKRARYDRITAKAFSYYVFLLFFRWAIVVIGIVEVEKFMQDLIAYLPSLFIGIVI